jgi:hypothetical protein
LSVFTEALFITIGVDLKFFYIVILLNLPLILTYKGFANATIQRWHLAIMAFFLVNGFVSIFIFKTNLLPNWLEQFVGISICSYYYYLFFSLFNKEEFLSLFRMYSYIAFLLIIIGYCTLPFDKYEGIKFRSLFIEPAHFATVCVPALFYFLQKKDTVKVIFFVLAFILTFSAVAFVGLLICILFKYKPSFKKFFVSILSVAVVSIITYNTIGEIRLRVDDSVRTLQTSNIEKANLSTYALLSNLFVMQNVFRESPIFGNGLGSHVLSHKKYLQKIEGIEIFEQYFYLNSKDANSLFIRVISDLGMFGILIMILFICKNYVTVPDEQNIIAKGILIYFLLKLLREGHYFSPEMYFFIFFYYFNNRYAEVEHDKEITFPNTSTPVSV